MPGSRLPLGGIHDATVAGRPLGNHGDAAQQGTDVASAFSDRACAYAKHAPNPACALPSQTPAHGAAYRVCRRRPLGAPLLMEPTPALERVTRLWGRLANRPDRFAESCGHCCVVTWGRLLHPPWTLAVGSELTVSVTARSSLARSAGNEETCAPEWHWGSRRPIQVTILLPLAGSPTALGLLRGLPVSCPGPFHNARSISEGSLL